MKNISIHDNIQSFNTSSNLGGVTYPHVTKIDKDIHLLSNNTISFTITFDEYPYDDSKHNVTQGTTWRQYLTENYNSCSNIQYYPYHCRGTNWDSASTFYANTNEIATWHVTYDGAENHIGYIPIDSDAYLVEHDKLFNAIEKEASGYFLNENGNFDESKQEEHDAMWEDVYCRLDEAITEGNYVFWI